MVGAWGGGIMAHTTKTTHPHEATRRAINPSDNPWAWSRDCEPFGCYFHTSNYASSRYTGAPNTKR